MTDAELDAAIADLEELLNSGVTETSADGTTHKFDIAAARTRLAELKRKKRKRLGKKTGHPYATPTFGSGD
ncbi:hypothetical protein [Stratiformator vulcanicus]|uniref:Uncharacterized protein n=1 Tax=Stratiformator vulcanicus TaxID=2527980 RepID=A0A517R762_9PLAN|nr:hypothetical protein [Stratiformator vulcanicus]QDT39734.1 hypothetical protein Pan189_41430 [Stratiformator vulcanicus]